MNNKEKYYLTKAANPLFGAGSAPAAAGKGAKGMLRGSKGLVQSSPTGMGSLIGSAGKGAKGMLRGAGDLLAAPVGKALGGLSKIVGSGTTPEESYSSSGPNGDGVETTTGTITPPAGHGSAEPKKPEIVTVPSSTPANSPAGAVAGAGGGADPQLSARQRFHTSNYNDTRRSYEKVHGAGSFDPQDPAINEKLRKSYGDNYKYIQF